jgi:DNA-binding MarR family transcriptional regulator
VTRPTGSNELRDKRAGEPYREAAALRAALRAFLAESKRVARAHGLTGERYQLLLFVKVASDDGQGTTVSELSSRLHLAQSGVTQLVRRAEDLGLIKRELSSQDARIRHLRLTAEGERRLRATVIALVEERATLISALTQLEHGDLDHERT